MKAWLVRNEFLYTNKFNEINQWLVEAAEKKGVQLEIKTNAQLLISICNKMEFLKEIQEWPAFVLFWEKDIRLAKALEGMGLKLFNSAKAIELCDDKALTHLTLARAGIKMPKTIIAPMTYENVGYTNYDFLEEIGRALSFPLVVKECFGSFGQQVYLCHNPAEFIKKVKKLGSRPMLFQEFIKASFGKDIRLQVVGKQVVATMYRYAENGDFRANITNGGKMKPYTPTQSQVDLALKCCEVIGLDFAGVDLLFDEQENPIVCEVNSNAHFKNIFECTGVNTADFIMDYILQRISL